MSSRLTPRTRRSRATSLVAILLLTVALAAVLAYEAWDAATRHRVTAERTVRDYAEFAAWEFAVSSKDVLYSTLLWTFSPVANIEVARHDQRLPDPSVMQSHKVDGLLCRSDSTRYYFRVDVRDGSFASHGQTPSSAMRRWVADTISRHALVEYAKDWNYATLFGMVEGAPRTVVYQLKRDTRGRAVAAYGFELCLTEFARGAFRKVMEHHAVLPPSLTKGLPNDSLFAVQVSDANGRELFRSPRQYPPTFSGEHTHAAFGGLVTRVSLNPDVASALVIGGLPESRLSLLLGVLALTVGLAAIGLAQLRREGELARLRSDFIASVSHELRTPLAQVRMFAETLLLGRVRSDAERDRSLRIIDQEARRLTHLVENILQFSRAERQAIRLTPVTADLAGQVRDALEAFAPVARARRVTLRSELEEPLVATADPDALRQIVLNLLDNAVKYGPTDQTVTVTLARDGGNARLVVDDQGPGIAPQDRTRVWEAFYRLEGAQNSAVAGSGIGLAVVAELVSLHGGRAWIDSAPGGGARFVVELPAGVTPPSGRDGAGAPAAARREGAMR